MLIEFCARVYTVAPERYPATGTAVRVSSPKEGGGAFRLVRYGFTSSYDGDLASGKGTTYFLERLDRSPDFSFVPDSLELIEPRRPLISSEVGGAA